VQLPGSPEPVHGLQDLGFGLSHRRQPSSCGRLGPYIGLYRGLCSICGCSVCALPRRNLGLGLAQGSNLGLP